MQKEALNPFKIAQEQLDTAAKKLKLDEATHQALRWPKRELHIFFPVKMDNGKIKIFEGFRVQHNDARGPCKGGIRFHPEETFDTVRALAAWMTWKTALVDIPLGGGKGGVVCNPKELSQNELENISRAYIDEVGRILGPDKDIPAPDVYTNPQIMAWMMDEYDKIKGFHTPGVITGKPIPLGGSLGRDDATARGGVFTIREAAKELKMDLKKATIAVQGYGNAGHYAASLMHEIFGSKILAVSDSQGGIYKAEGIDPAKALQHKQKTGTVVCLTGTEKITNEELLALDVDILIPSALENVITAKNAGKIKAKILAELANGPTTPEADDILYKNKVFVLPDFLCNAGGVTVSYFEYVQNIYNYYWDEETVHKRLDAKMTKAFHSVIEMAKKEKVNHRVAAYLVAVSRVAEAMKLRGWV